MSEHLRCRIFRVNTVISRIRLLKKEQVFHCFFVVCFGGGGGGGAIFPQSRFNKAIISIHMYIVGSSIYHSSKYQTSKFFFLHFQNRHPGSLDFQNLKVSGSPAVLSSYSQSPNAFLSFGTKYVNRLRNSDYINKLCFLESVKAAINCICHDKVCFL